MTGEKQTHERRRMAAEAVRGMNPSNTKAWESLNALSSATSVDSLEIFEDEILLEDGAFRGSLIWHVTLVYHDPEGDITVTDSFPGTFRGVFQEGRAEVETMTADTSSFYQ